MRTRSALLGATLLTAVSSVAFAQSQPRGFYVGGALGGSYQNDSDFSGGAINNSAEYDLGVVGLIALGYAYGNGLRTELEFGGRWNNVQKAQGAGASGGEGDVAAYSIMANVLYDIATGTPWTPYIGAGIGWAFLDYNGIQTFNGGNTVDGTDNQFAYQAIIGVDYSINNNWKVGLQGRYFATLDPSVNSTAGTTVDTDYGNWSILASLRYTFWTPPPPPVAAPAPAPAAPAPAPAPAAAPIQRSYLVFFDWDKSAITPEAARVIQQAADNAKRGGISRIVVTGYTDTSGTAEYNQKLSERRAVAVRDELVKDGLTGGQITTVGKGETDLLVKTGDGVREPQNRRAEIVLQ